MRRLLVLIGAASALLAVFSAGCGKDNPASPGGTPAVQAKYVGVNSCRMCHMGEAKGHVYEIWLASAHAKAFETLGTQDQSNPVCLPCHTTGFGGVIAAGKTAQDLQGVQCEACHGAGSEYKALSVMKDRALALRKGLVPPGPSMCAPCHRVPLPRGHVAVPSFDYPTALAKIEHYARGL